MRRLSCEAQANTIRLVEDYLLACCDDPSDFTETLDDLFFCFARYELTQGLTHEYAERVIHEVEVMKRFFKALEAV